MRPFFGPDSETQASAPDGTAQTRFGESEGTRHPGSRTGESVVVICLHQAVDRLSPVVKGPLS